MFKGIAQPFHSTNTLNAAIIYQYLNDLSQSDTGTGLLIIQNPFDCRALFVKWPGIRFRLKLSSVEVEIDTQVPAVDLLWWIVSFSSFLLALAKERCAFVDRLNRRDQPFFTRGWRRSRCGSNQDLSKLFSLKDCHRKIYTYMQRGDDRRLIDFWSWAKKYFHNLQYLNDRTFLSLAWLSRISPPTVKSSFCGVSAWLWVWF